MKNGNKIKRSSIVSLVIFTIAVLIYFMSNYPLSISKENLWSIGIYTGASPFTLKDPDSIHNPVLTVKDVNDVPASFVADPFLFKKDSMWYLFFEVMNSASNHGDIGLAVSKNCKNWEYKQIVLDKEYHLSYPFVFEWGKEVFMIPECATAGVLNLYKATDFPFKWEYEKTIIKGEFGDHALLRHDNKWWLMACSKPYTHDVLRLYYADSLNGNWIEHKASPIVNKNPHIARPAGKIIKIGNKIYRISQNCKPAYGNSVNAYQIIELTLDEYQEIPLKNNPILKRGKRGWNRHGMHQIDAYEFEDSLWIAAVDGYKKHFIMKIEY